MTVTDIAALLDDVLRRPPGRRAGAGGGDRRQSAPAAPRACWAPPRGTEPPRKGTVWGSGNRAAAGEGSAPLQRAPPRAVRAGGPARGPGRAAPGVRRRDRVEESLGIGMLRRGE